MNWTTLLEAEIEATYGAAFGLMDLVNDAELDWKPATGSNWMTTGQLLQHLTTACGACCKGFVTGDWGMPEGVPESELDMIPSADKMPAAKSVADARALLEADKALALTMVREAGLDRLANQLLSAPWNPEPRPLGRQLLHMVLHLHQHKGQLFYYLKLQGKPVHTGTLWGM